MEELATHGGTVIRSSEGHVQVQMQVTSACSQCEGHAHCTFAEKKEKVVDIDTPHWQQYAPGDNVQVVISSGRGLLAVLLAYVLPALLLLGVFALLYALRLSEVWVAVGALLAVALYGGVLYLCRHHLQRRFTFQILDAQ